MIGIHFQVLLPSPSSSCTTNRPINWETGCWGRNSDFIWKASRQRRYLCPRDPSCLGLDASFFYKQRVGVEEVKFKKVIVVANISWFQPDSGRGVLIASFWQSFIGGPWWGCFLWAKWGYSSGLGGRIPRYGPSHILEAIGNLLLVINCSENNREGNGNPF